MVKTHANKTGVTCLRKHRFAFSAENARQSVVSLAYSSCNELLGSVYADGEINIFGLKTTVKMDNFHLDRGFVGICICVVVEQT